MNPDMDMFSSMVSSTCTLGNMVPYSKPFIYRNRAVQEKNPEAIFTKFPHFDIPYQVSSNSRWQTSASEQ